MKKKIKKNFFIMNDNSNDNKKIIIKINKNIADKDNMINNIIDSISNIHNKDEIKIKYKILLLMIMIR